jgi:hypothetical protein
MNRTKAEFLENYNKFSKYEIITANKISDILNDNNYSRNYDCKYDIKFKNYNLTVEFKADYKTHITNNFFIEYVRKIYYKKTGLSVSKANFYCLIDKVNDNFYIIPTYLLKHLCKTHEQRYSKISNIKGVIISLSIIIENSVELN